MRCRSTFGTRSLIAYIHEVQSSIRASDALEFGIRSTTATQVLVINAGSSSLKWAVLDAYTEALITEGSTSWEGTEGGRHSAEMSAVLSHLPHVELVGVSGVSADWRAAQAAAAAGNERAELARAIVVHQLVAAVGAMAATLGGLDALVFTGGIGENSAEVRQAVAAGLSFAGVQLAVPTDAIVEGDRDVAATDSSARVLVVAAREYLTVLAEVRRLVLSEGE